MTNQEHGKSAGSTGKGLSSAAGQGKVWDLTGTDPKTGAALPPRRATTAEWRTEKLGQQGYVKPADLDETADPGTTDSGGGTTSGGSTTSGT